MSHELTIRNDGFVEFAYLASEGKTWHGLGQSVADDAGHDAWRVAAGMDWRIQRGIVRYAVDRAGTQAELPDQHVLFRSDSKAPLGIVSDSYRVVQPDELLRFFEGVATRSGFRLSAAGTLRGGRRFWATARIGEGAPVSVRDRIGGYLLLSTSADGSLATEARLTTTRVVCANTLAMARGEGKAAVRITHRSTFDPDTVRLDLGLTDAAWAGFKADMVRLANRTVLLPEAENFVSRLLAAAPTQEAADKARETRGFQRILSLFDGEAKGSQFDGVRETRYGLLQAVTEYADHHVRAASDENRFIAAQWGSGGDLKDRAYRLLLA